MSGMMEEEEEEEEDGGGETDEKTTGEAEDVVRPASTALNNTNKLERSPR